MGSGPAGTSPRESSHKHCNEEARENSRPDTVPKEEYSVKGAAAEDAKPPTGLKIRKKCGLASRRATPGAQRPPTLTLPSREDKAADAGSADPEVRPFHLKPRDECAQYACHCSRYLGASEVQQELCGCLYY